MSHRPGRLICLLTIICVAAASGRAIAEGPTNQPASKVSFKRRQLDAKFRSEGVAVGDFNKDGQMDIAAGSVWYQGPDWTMHAVEDTPKAFDPKNYSNSFVNFAEDVNGDGWADLMVVDFPSKPTWWFENPRGSAGPWKRHMATPVTNNESPQFLDVDGDGRRELIMAFSPDPDDPDGPERRMAIVRRDADADKPWIVHPISAKAAPGTRRYSHGLGAGDINGDGRDDIVVTQGWWESPVKAAPGEWTFHNVDFGPAAAQMFVYDFDGDGDNDVLSSSAHNYGIWWHEQLPAGAWTTHVILKSFSQTHGMCMADINGDGLPDFVTGKRWWAHGGKDPGGNDPAVFYWFELKCAGGRPQWIAHQFDDNSGPGTQFEVADVNGDGLLDVVSSNKKGVHYFEQVRR